MLRVNVAKIGLPLTAPLISSVIGILSRLRNVLSNDNHSIDGLSSKASVFQSFGAIQATILEKGLFFAPAASSVSCVKKKH